MSDMIDDIQENIDAEADDGAYTTTEITCLLSEIEALREQVEKVKRLLEFLNGEIGVILDHHTRPRQGRGNTSARCIAMREAIRALDSSR